MKTLFIGALLLAGTLADTYSIRLEISGLS